MVDLYERLNWIKSKMTVMSTIRKCQPIGIRRISEKCGISERRTRRVLDELRKDGVVKATSKGEVLIGSYESYATGMLNEVTSHQYKVAVLTCEIVDECAIILKRQKRR